MICKKKIFVLMILCFLNACTSPTAMLGPVYTFSSTGSIYQSSLAKRFKIREKKREYSKENFRK